MNMLANRDAEDIVDGLLDGTYSREQVIGWLSDKFEDDSLRDGFAMAALEGLLANGALFASLRAYAYADEMMKARVAPRR